MIRTSLLAASVALGLMATSASADPFDVSENRCADEQLRLMCLQVEFASSDIEMTVGEFAANEGITVERLRKLNGWGPEVTANTLIVPNRRFAFWGQI